MNSFSLTLSQDLFDRVTKSRRLELVGIAERRLYLMTTGRGTIDTVTLYAKDRPAYYARFVSATETDGKIIMRFQP